jgi:nicotinamidase-related amidase
MNDKLNLLDAGDSILIVIDVQDFFLNKLEKPIARRLVERIRWLVQVANWLEIPVMVTAEDIPDCGPTTAPVREVLPADASDLNKLIFGLAGQQDILDSVVATNRKTAVLAGLETDVCVQHSAMGLASQGFNVAVVADATASPDIGHDIGIERMRQAGITIVSTKSLFFEWVRDLDTCHRLRSEISAETPADLYI